jgi:Uma2 family endonuclease
MSVQIAKHYITACEFERMVETSVFEEGARLELIEGEIVEMSPIGKRHAACVDRLAELFREALGRQVIVRVQNPIQLDDFSEPQPDIALLRRREDFYEGALPTPADVLLLVEVADTSVEYDRQLKLPIYARARVAEVWIVNLPDERIETYSRPSGERYESASQHVRGEEISASTLAAISVKVDDVL